MFEKDWHIRTLLRAVQAEIENSNQLFKNLPRLLKKSVGSYMQASTVSNIQVRECEASIKFIRLCYKSFVKV